MDKIDALVLDVYQEMQNMFARLDSLDEEKEKLLSLYPKATGQQKIALEQAMIESKEKYKALLKQMKQLQAKVEGTH